MDTFAEFMLRDFLIFGFVIQYWLLAVIVFFCFVDSVFDYNGAVQRLSVSIKRATSAQQGQTEVAISAIAELLCQHRRKHWADLCSRLRGDRIEILLLRCTGR